MHRRNPDNFSTQTKFETHSQGSSHGVIIPLSSYSCKAVFSFSLILKATLRLGLALGIAPSFSFSLHDSGNFPNPVNTLLCLEINDCFSLPKSSTSISIVLHVTSLLTCTIFNLTLVFKPRSAMSVLQTYISSSEKILFA
uniref:Uncharacterized protein n=1 Tax=Cacopsylla melanoneura TaxID=428564 RepID=A0A8D8ZRX5_9HEMI